MAAPTEPRLQLSLNTTNRSQSQPSSSFAAARPAASTEHAHQLPAALQAGNLHSSPGSVATTVPVASSGTAASTQPVQQPLGYQQALSSIAATVPATSPSTALPAQPVQQLSGSQQRLSSVATTVPLACTRSASPTQHSWPINTATQASRGPAAQTVQPAGDSQPGHSPDQPATPGGEQAQLDRPPPGPGKIAGLSDAQLPPGEGRDLPGLSQDAAQSSEARPAATSSVEHGLQPAEEATSSEDVEVVLDASDTSPAQPSPAAAAAVGHQGTGASGPSGSALSRQAGNSFQSRQGSAQPAAAIRQSSRPAAACVPDNAAGPLGAAPVQPMAPASPGTGATPGSTPDVAGGPDQVHVLTSGMTGQGLQSPEGTQVVSPYPSSTSGVPGYSSSCACRHVKHASSWCTAGGKYSALQSCRAGPLHTAACQACSVTRPSMLWPSFAGCCMLTTACSPQWCILSTHILFRSVELEPSG